jgi:hypothetical protein
MHGLGSLASQCQAGRLDDTFAEDALPPLQLGLDGTGGLQLPQLPDREEEVVSLEQPRE